MPPGTFGTTGAVELGLNEDGLTVAPGTSSTELVSVALILEGLSSQDDIDALCCAPIVVWFSLFCARSCPVRFSVLLRMLHFFVEEVP